MHINNDKYLRTKGLDNKVIEGNYLGRPGFQHTHHVRAKFIRFWCIYRPGGPMQVGDRWMAACMHSCRRRRVIR